MTVLTSVVAVLLLGPLEVKDKLLAWLKKKKIVGDDASDLQDIPPLQLPNAVKASGQGDAKSRKVCSYKEMWRAENGKHSLLRNAMYEAGGSGFWISLQAADSCPVHMGSWNQLLEAKKLFSASAHCSGRILWPVTMECVVKSVSDISPQGREHPSSLQLVCNHLILAGWWVAMSEAIRAGENDRVSELYECILTVTIRVLLWKSDAMVMRVALAAAEKARVLECTTDNILVFSERLHIIVQEIISAQGEVAQQKIVDMLKSDGVLYQGKPVTRNLLAAADSFVKNLSVRSKSLLQFLESKWGRQLLTDGPTKLYRLVVQCSKWASAVRLNPKPQVCDVVEMILSCLALALDSDTLSSEACTTEFLTGKESRASDTVSWCSMILAQIGLGQHAINLIQLLDQEQCSDQMKLVMTTLLNPVLWRQELLKNAKATLKRELTNVCQNWLPYVFRRDMFCLTLSL